MKTVKIISGGTPGSTNVIDAETGAVIHGVSGVAFSVGLGKVAVADLQIVLASVEMTAAARFVAIDPVDGGVKSIARIVFSDGTEREFPIVGASSLSAVRAGGADEDAMRELSRKLNEVGP